MTVKFIKSLLLTITLLGFLPTAFADDAASCASFYNTKNYKNAFATCTIAAEQGDTYSAFLLAFLYTNGQGIPKDYKQAVYWYAKLANQGNHMAQHNLATIYFTGEGAPQDYKQAIYWFTKAAKQGAVNSQVDLGVMHYFGNGTIKDTVVAYAWWNVAAAQGNENAQEKRDAIEKVMTPSQLEKGQELSKEYYKKYVK
jgi:TPR repeat protein